MQFFGPITQWSLQLARCTVNCKRECVGKSDIRTVNMLTIVESGLCINLEYWTASLPRLPLIDRTAWHSSVLSLPGHCGACDACHHSTTQQATSLCKSLMICVVLRIRLAGKCHQLQIRYRVHAYSWLIKTVTQCKRGVLSNIRRIRPPLIVQWNVHVGYISLPFHRASCSDILYFSLRLLQKQQHAADADSGLLFWWHSQDNSFKLLCLNSFHSCSIRTVHSSDGN